MPRCTSSLWAHISLYWALSASYSSTALWLMAPRAVISRRQRLRIVCPALGSKPSSL